MKVKNPKNSNIKSVAVRHPKSASNLLNAVTQSNRDTQEMETVKKPNIFHKESVTVNTQILLPNYQSP